MEGFEILDKLGDGAYSVVYKVRRKEDGNIYALKKVKLENLSDKEKQNALNEVRILASVKSTFVISYKEAFIEEKEQSLCIVMEFADKGDLYQKIVQFKKMGCLIEEIDIWRIFIQMTRGLKALHDLKILHRDLKSANIFLFSDGSAKIGDLNVSKVARKGMGYTQTGTPYYASPEVWKDQPYDNKSDIWSLACITYEMLTLHPPFRAENMEGLYNKVIKGQYGKICDRYSQDIAEIIKLLLKVNPADRPTCAQILKHPLIKKRLEFFQAQAGKEDEDIENMDEGMLLKTIRIPKNILFLTDKLPTANYGNQKNNLLKQISNCNSKKLTFPSNCLPDIKIQINNEEEKNNIHNSKKILNNNANKNSNNNYNNNNSNTSVKSNKITNNKLASNNLSDNKIINTQENNNIKIKIIGERNLPNLDKIELNDNTLQKPTKKNKQYDKYLQGLGINEDIYKIYAPHLDLNYKIPKKNINNNNRYKMIDKYKLYLPNLYGHKRNSSHNPDLANQPKIIPNKRLNPIGKK